jgi:Na+/citrate or Na+/malate symporter
MKRRKILTVVLVTLALLAAFTGGYATGYAVERDRDEKLMNTVFHVIREGGSGDTAIPGIQISPRWEDDSK